MKRPGQVLRVHVQLDGSVRPPLELRERMSKQREADSALAPGRAYRERLDVISARSVTQKNVSEPSDADAGEPALALSNFKRILDIVDRGGA